MVAMNLRTEAFKLWFRVSRAMTLGVRAIVEDEAGRVLLVRHTYVGGLFLPGGGVEHGEPAETALERELVEEAGIHMHERAALLGMFSNHAVFRNDHVLLYHVKHWRQGEATSRGEISETVWVDPRRPPDDATPGTLRRLAAVYDGEVPGLHW